MKRLKWNRESISIKTIIIISYIVLMLTTIAIIGGIVFSNWFSIADGTITNIANEINKELYRQIDAFILAPEHIIKVNRNLLENGIVNLNNEAEREKFFVEILKSNREDVYSFSYGTENGEYYGARRNKENHIEIMKNDAETGGHSWYYSVTEHLTAGERVADAGKFDPRTRNWYIRAKETQGLIFSPIYMHFVMDDLTLSASVPIYNREEALQGVLGVHIILPNVNKYLKEITDDRNAIAFIIEKDSGELVANSVDQKNFTQGKEGQIKRLTLNEIDHQSIIQAYTDYKQTGNRKHQIKDQGGKLYIDLSEYNKEGLDWVIITAIPSGLFTEGIIRNMILTVLLAILAVIISITIYLKLTNNFLKPIDHLIDTTEKFSRGNLSQRATVFRDDEIGKISKAFNKMAETIFSLVTELESKVKERTLEFEQANSQLNESKEQLQLILDSTVEAIFGIDLEGKCTFCNASSLKILGYKSQDELIGREIHFLIHHTNKVGEAIDPKVCKLYRVLKDGVGVKEDDEVFWRADGTSVHVEYYSYPQFKDGKIIGAVVTFVDNTERKKNEKHIKYLSYHDSLTGLYNRMYFENALKELDTKNNLPISIIYGDVNELKLINDVFGHAAGDELLIKSAEILKKHCRQEDIVARMGGDEFAILLLNRDINDSRKIANRISSEFSKEQIMGIRGSVSVGYQTKTKSKEDIHQTIETAEEKMYKQKILDRKANDSAVVKTIIETLHDRSPREKCHSIAVGEICENIARAMKMPEPQVNKLKSAGYLHDIGKIALNEDLIKKEGVRTAIEKREMEKHAVVGYRILNLFEDTLDLAEGVLSHHENWDGSGYPKGLKGKEIPEQARIIAVAESYDAMTNSLKSSRLSKEEAIEELQKQAGIKLDPDIVDIFVKIIS